MNLTKYQKALIYIHRAEIKYGSISKTPENDPDLIKAQKGNFVPNLDQK